MAGDIMMEIQIELESRGDHLKRRDSDRNSFSTYAIAWQHDNFHEQSLFKVNTTCIAKIHTLANMFNQISTDLTR
jgi:hypothetical protein